MNDINSWDWETDVKEIPFSEWENTYNWVEEPCVTPDGEKIASIVNCDDSDFRVCVNGSLWDESYEKAWGLTSSPGGQVCVLTVNDDEWTVAVDGNSWENRFDYLWDLTISKNGEHIAVSTQSDMSYSVCVNDKSWENTYDSLTGMVVNNLGVTAAVVQTEPISSADIEAFKKGAFAVAVEGNVGSPNFLNAWDIAFNHQGTAITAAVRTSLTDYSVLQGTSCWKTSYPCIWKPVYSADNQSVFAPVKGNGGWSLFRNDERYWKTRYNQLWDLTVCPDGSRLAAIVSNSFGRWTVAEDDTIWDISAGNMVTGLFYSDDGNTLVTCMKDNNTWFLAVNGKRWNTCADKLWKPSVSSSGDVIAARVEIKGRFYILVNDKKIPGNFDMAFQPEISPDGRKVMIKVIQDGIYMRKIVSMNDIL